MWRWVMSGGGGRSGVTVTACRTSPTAVRRALFESRHLDTATASWVLIATALASCTIGVTLACTWSDALFTRAMNCGSSELSDSCLATIRTRFANLAILAVLSTIFCGWFLRIASSQRIECFWICSSDILIKSAESVASSQSALTCWTESEYWATRFWKCSSAALLSG